MPGYPQAVEFVEKLGSYSPKEALDQPARGLLLVLIFKDQADFFGIYGRLSDKGWVAEGFEHRFCSSQLG